MKFVLFRAWTIRGRLWFWHLKAANHEIIAQGEGYRNKDDALDAIDLIQNIPESTPVRVIP